MNIENVLLDINYFIESIKKDKNYSFVTVTGKGISGAIAALFRQRFPHSCDASISRNAVTSFNFTNNNAFNEYLSELETQECQNSV